MKDEWRRSERRDRDAGLRGVGIHLFEDRSEFLPLLPCALTAANQNASPESIDALSEGASADRCCREQHGIGSNR